MVGGQLAPDAGSVKLGGVELVGLRPEAIWRQGVGRTFQIAETFASLTVVENVQMALLSHAGRVRRFWTPAQGPVPRRGDRPARERRHGGAGRARDQRAGLRRRQAGRARDGPGAQAAPAADGRADRRHGAARAQRIDGAGPGPGARAVDRRPLHRAQHGRGVRPCRPDHRPGPRRADRRRPARGGARRRPGARGLLRRRHDLRRTGGRSSVPQGECRCQHDDGDARGRGASTPGTARRRSSTA